MTNLEVQKRDLEKILANRPAKCSPAREAEYKRFQETLDAINKYIVKQSTPPVPITAPSDIEWDASPEEEDWG